LESELEAEVGLAGGTGDAEVSSKLGEGVRGSESSRLPCYLRH
jgi:hypothetical protein